ncbi:hypothetical protein INT80_15025 [Gallibacterium anatis]|uniref:Uncharacterized protein n=1 Tax=Gallibacterium anatis TaxID=750 RepID=A0A930Y4C0_9PAST|nr:hypothetical protein [Gallibacterium anatis]
MTSLAGFEALLAEVKTVYCWFTVLCSLGLTIDAYDLQRRKRKLTLEQLIAELYYIIHSI